MAGWTDRLCGRSGKRRGVTRPLFQRFSVRISAQSPGGEGKRLIAVRGNALMKGMHDHGRSLYS